MTRECDSNPDNKDAVYYDGSCPMCVAIVGKIDDSSKADNFLMKDITREPLPSTFTRQDVEQEMHVVGADGKIYRNAEAILKLLEPYPAWKLAVTVGRLPASGRYCQSVTTLSPPTGGLCLVRQAVFIG
jgi:predicted DCC family thiol-disulfide oxidoreductase YuxK